MTDLQAARAKRWRYTGRKIASLARAASWIDDVGFAMLWPKDSLPVPALWIAGSDDDGSWGPDAERMWKWKDELPRRGHAWYGPFLFGRKSFLSLQLLNDLYPREGAADDYRQASHSPTARKIADILLASGPQSAAALREATDLTGKKGSPVFTRAMSELGRALVITHFGIEEQGAGWPSAVFELTTRAFVVHPTSDPVAAARTFLDTTIQCKPNELARAFGWSAADARSALEELVARKLAHRERSVFRIAPE